MCEILAINFTEDRLNPLLDAHLDLIDDDWDTATNNFFDLSDVQDGINGNSWDGGPMGGPYQGLKKYVTERIITMEADLSGLSHTCSSIPPAIDSQDIVINEFMAQNIEGSPWFDQDNENDDWVELYNNTDNPINLNNYFLSDSPSFIHKWEFPDVTINAHDFLIVWTDKDPQQTGLHTKFNLDKNGDELILSYIDGTIIDSVDYTEEQADNRSLSRIPNGTGDFMVADVTFDALNSNDGAGTTSLLEQGISIYPNPADNKLNIVFSKTPASRISIINSLGQNIYHANNVKDNLQVNISNWKTGIYHIKLISKNYTVSKKLIVK
jgi:hypothetical protein